MMPLAFDLFGLDPFALAGKVVDGVSSLLLEGRLFDFLRTYPASAATFFPWVALILAFIAQIVKKGPTATFSLAPGTWKLLIAGCFTFSTVGLVWMGVIDVEDRIEAHKTHQTAPKSLQNGHSDALKPPARGKVPGDGNGA
jgi:hypothetical protein